MAKNHTRLLCQIYKEKNLKYLDVKPYFNGKDGQVYCDFMKNGKQYVYAHLQKDTGELFYIGIGKGNRINQIRQRNKYWKNIHNNHGLITKFLHINITLKEAKELEKMYIKLLSPKANMTIGGEAGNNEKTRTSVFCYKKDGTFYKKFESISDANVFFNTKENNSRINRCLKGERLSFNGFIWKDYFIDNVEPYKKSKPHNTKPVYRYDLNGNFVEKLDKISDFKEGNRSGISGCLDKNYTYYNSFWRSYYADKIKVDAPKKAIKMAKKVINIETGDIFESISKAAQSVNCCRSVLERKLSGIRKNNTTLKYYE